MRIYELSTKLKRIAFGVLVSSALAYLWVSSYVTPVRLTPSAMLAGLAVVLAGLWTVLTRRPTLDKDFRWLLAVSGALLAWAAAVYWISSHYPAGLWPVLQMGLGIGIAFAVFTSVDSRSTALVFVAVLLVGFVVSAVVGIGQHFAGAPFVGLWELVGGGPQSTPDAGRSAPGLAPTTILFGYQMAVAVPLAVGLLVSGVFAGKKALRVVVAGTVVALGLALLVSGSRSAVGAGFMGTAFVCFLLRFNRRRKLMFPLAVALVLGVALYFAVGLAFDPVRFVGMEDRSAQVRIPMQLTAVRYALQHPLGTGMYEIDETYIPAEVEPRLEEEILRHRTHNQLLNVLVCYGFPGFGLLILFYGLVVKRVRGLWNALGTTAMREGEWLVAGCAGAMLSYFLNSLLHNAGPFVGDVFHWYVIGLLFSLRWTEGTVAGAAEGTGGPGNGA